MTLDTLNLVPLCKISTRLNVKMRRLVELSEQGEFPPVYNIGAPDTPRWRVCQDQVEEWLASRTADQQAALKSQRIARAKARARAVSSAARRRAGARRGRGSTAGSS